MRVTLIEETEAEAQRNSARRDGIHVDSTPGMRVRKRNGNLEPVDINRIVNASSPERRPGEGLVAGDDRFADLILDVLDDA